jgi:hypothetical protein
MFEFCFIQMYVSKFKLHIIQINSFQVYNIHINKKKSL